MIAQILDIVRHLSKGNEVEDIGSAHCNFMSPRWTTMSLFDEWANCISWPTFLLVIIRPHAMEGDNKRTLCGCFSCKKIYVGRILGKL